MKAGEGVHRGIRIRITSDVGTVLEADSDSLHLMVALGGAEGEAMEVFSGVVQPASHLPDTCAPGFVGMWVTPVWLPDLILDPEEDDGD